MDRASLIFCTSALLGALLLAALAFPFAAKSRAVIDAARTPQAAERLGVVDLGPYGKVTVSELLAYYIENPPKAADSPAKEKVRFQGC